jgi:hypothetical protein
MIIKLLSNSKNLTFWHQKLTHLHYSNVTFANMNEEISISSRIIADLEKVRIVVEQLFPDNNHQLIEDVFSSEGDIFECTIEPRNNRPVKQLYLSGTYHGDKAAYESFLSSLVTAFNKNEIVYSIDSEFKEGDEYVEKTVFHPDFDRLNALS